MAHLLPPLQSPACTPHPTPRRLQCADPVTGAGWLLGSPRCTDVPATSHQRPRVRGAEEGLEHIFLPSRQVHEVALPSTASQVTAEAAKHLREASSDLQKPPGAPGGLEQGGPSTVLCPFPFLDCPYSLTLLPTGQDL